VRTREQLFGVLEHGLEDALQRLCEVVVQVVLAVYGQVVLQRIDGVLGLVCVGGGVGVVARRGMRGGAFEVGGVGRARRGGPRGWRGVEGGEGGAARQMGSGSSGCELAAEE
jgi:hypothetical protein